MDYGRLALVSALQSKSITAFTDRGVKPEMLPDAESQSVLKFIYDFHGQHGSVPGPSTVETAFPAYRLGGQYAPEPTSYYVAKVLELYARSAATDALLSSAKRLRAADAFDVIVTTQAEMGKLGLLRTKRTERKVDENTHDRWQRWLDRKNGVGLVGIPTPWDSLDELTQGWQEEDYIVIVARPKVGKTWMMLRLAYAAWMAGKKVMFVNRELPDKLMERRWDALHAKLCYERFRSGLLTDAEEARYELALQQLAAGTFPEWVWVHGALTVSAIGAKIEEHQPDIVFVDGAYLLVDEDGGRAWWEKNMNISRGLKRLPQRYKVPLVATTQLARSGDTKKNKDNELTLSDVGGSDAFAQDADLLLGLDQPGDARMRHELYIIPLAVREAPPDTIKVEWNFDTMESRDLGKQKHSVTVPDEKDTLDFAD